MRYFVALLLVLCTINNAISVPPTNSAPIRVVWQGLLNVLQSQAYINREVLLRLQHDPHIDLSIATTLQKQFSEPQDRRYEQLQPLYAKPLVDVDVVVRHQWFGDLNAVIPVRGRFVLWHPWEFCALQTEWMHVFANVTDELWVYSHHNRECYIRSGIAAEKVHVIPLGVETEFFTSVGVVPYTLHSQKAFTFLYVGGTLKRKGIEVLLEGYLRAFTMMDDVCLVIKDLAPTEYYAPLTQRELIQKLLASPNRPCLEYIDASMSAWELRSLYAAADVLVSPYKAEGFGLPMLEAMSMGKAVIATAEGPSKDFLTDEFGLLIPAVEVDAEMTVATVMPPKLLEPDLDALVSAMRWAAAHPQAMAQKGQAAARFVRQRFTWDHTVAAVSNRLQVLAKRPILRFAAEAAAAKPGNGNSGAERFPGWADGLYSAVPLDEGGNSLDVVAVVQSATMFAKAAGQAPSAKDFFQFFQTDASNAVLQKWKSAVTNSQHQQGRVLLPVLQTLQRLRASVAPSQDASDVFLLQPQFIDLLSRLAASPAVTTACLFGFGSGAAASVILSSQSNVSLYIFDRFEQPHSHVANALLYSLYAPRLYLVPGAISATVPIAAADPMLLRCQLLVIDETSATLEPGDAVSVPQLLLAADRVQYSVVVLQRIRAPHETEALRRAAMPTRSQCVEERGFRLCYGV